MRKVAKQHTLIVFAIDFLVNMSASADVLAQAKVEINLGSIPEGKNVRHPTTAPAAVAISDTIFRLSSSGVESPSSSVTAPSPRSRKHETPSGNPSVTLSPTRTVCKSQNGSSCWVSAHIWVVCQLARLVTLVVGSARATVLTTISLDVHERARLR